MVLNLLVDIVFSLLDLIKGSFLLSIIVFALVLIGIFIQRKLIKKFKLSWIKSSLISTFIIVFIFVFAMYVFPLALGFSGTDPGILPQGFEMTATEYLFLIGMALFKVILLSFILTVFLLPLQFVGLFAMDFLKKKYSLPFIANVFFAVFCSTLVGSFIVIYLFPWIPTGIVYLLYFA
ncbi:hypothetical protein KJ660_01160 [Candidatus Micrarchaeota archaeon]|nr:hypothetical protein [Candidatus Micrarchaeota archaeon]